MPGTSVHQLMEFDPFGRGSQLTAASETNIHSPRREKASNVCLGSKLGGVEELAMWSGIKVDPLFCCVEARRSSRATKIPKSVGTRTHTCLLPLRLSSGSEKRPLNGTVVFVSVWKGSIMQQIFGRILNIPSLLTRPNIAVAPSVIYIYAFLLALSKGEDHVCTDTVVSAVVVYILYLEFMWVL